MKNRSTLLWNSLLRDWNSQNLTVESGSDDVCVCHSKHKIRISGLFIRPSRDRKYARVVVAFGNYKWRGLISIVTTAFDKNRSDFNIKCSCMVFKSNGDCLHLKRIRYYPITLLRMKSRIVRNVAKSPEELRRSNLSIVNLPSDGKENFALMFVYRRNFVGKVSIACSFVTLDCCRKLMPTSLKHRFSCKTCNGAAENVGLCIHESNLLDWSLSIVSRTIGLKDDGTIGIVETNEIVGIETNCDRQVAFSSTRKRNIFPCSIEESMIKTTIEEICKVGNHAKTETNEPLFVGIDHTVECNRCVMEIDVSHENEGLF